MSCKHLHSTPAMTNLRTGGTTCASLDSKSTRLLVTLPERWPMREMP
uniref:Uncharacterized protein n=1 Tax=Anguilla anguilla TaxID=7936 RepID=A0A0E9XMK7_ANGAN